AARAARPGSPQGRCPARRTWSRTYRRRACGSRASTSRQVWTPAELLVRQDDDFSCGHGGRFKRRGVAGQSELKSIKAMVTMKVRPALTMIFYRSLTTNVRSSFAFAGESVRQAA